MTNPQPEIKVPCEVYSRVVGYLRPVRNWNKGKKQEFADRQPYALPLESTSESENADQGSD